MNHPFLKRKVLVVGAGISGLSAANLLSSRGAFVKITTLDFDSERWGGDIYSVLDSRVDVELGRHSIEFARGVQTVVVSPGVKKSNPIVQWALENGVPVIGETECAYFFARAPIIAVTGTNGKSTTVELMARVLKAGGLTVRLGGNLDIPLSGLVLQEGKVDYYVLEMSSFQLEWTYEFSPWVAAILNVAPNHLDHHVSYQEYVDAKFRIFNRQNSRDYAVVTDVLNARYAEKLERAAAQKIIIQSLRPETGMAFVREGWIWGRYPQLHNARRIMPLDEIRIPGQHNVTNVLTVASVAMLAAVPPEAIREGVAGFTGLAHRIRTVRVHGGVTYVDDSKSTTPDSTRAALETVGKPVILLMGGIEKSYDFATLKPLMESRVKLLIVFGRCANMLYGVFSESTRVVSVGSMQEAVEVAARHAREGDTVLLSPACASFDMFSSYKERGDVFCRCVEALGVKKNESPQPPVAVKKNTYTEIAH